MNDSRGLAATETAQASLAHSAKPDGPALAVRLSLHHAARGQEFTLDVAFQAAPGFTILFGASGAGKTTLLDCIAGLRSPDSGHLRRPSMLRLRSGTQDMYFRAWRCFHI
jgi:ABC-type bacteriocin/lantibiotic exporter with double-glycine peptidase domain